MNRTLQNSIKTVVFAALAAAVLGAQAPIASARGHNSSSTNSSRQNDASGQWNQQSYVSNGNKHYWYNGQEFAMNLTTKDRSPVIVTTTYSGSTSNDPNNSHQRQYSNIRENDASGQWNQQSYVANGDKHYSYGGHEWTMNLGTRERHQVADNGDNGLSRR